MSKRIPQVNQLIKRELAKIILKEFEFPAGILVTVTRVETSINLNQARVYVSSIPEEKKKTVFQILNRKIYDIQQNLNTRLNMRPVPKIKFVEEEKTAGAGRIEEILEKLKKEEKQNRGDGAVAK